LSYYKKTGLYGSVLLRNAYVAIETVRGGESLAGVIYQVKRGRLYSLMK